MDQTIELILPKLTLKCPLHPNQILNKVCIDSKCPKSGLFCTLCEFHSETHLKPIETYMMTIAENIENLSAENSKLYEEIFTSPENANLSKWQEDNAEHLKKVDDHIVAQKVLIAEDFANLLSQLSETCQAIKSDLMNKLDEYVKEYKSNFSNFKNFIDESFIINKKYKYYGNVNNLAAKISSELPKNLNSLINNFKSVIQRTQEINENKKTTIKRIKKMAEELNELTNNLPFYRNSCSYDKFFEEISTKMEKYFASQIEFPSSSSFFSFFKKNPSFPSPLPLPSNSNDPPIQKSRSKTAEKIFENRNERLDPLKMEGLSNFADLLHKVNYSCENKNLVLSTVKTNISEFQMKFSKCVACDFTLTCMIVISDTQVALGARDNFLRIYDWKSQKLIHSSAAHNEPIVSFYRLYSEEKYLVAPSSISISSTSVKRKTFVVSASSDRTVFIWLLGDGGIPILYQKLAGFAGVMGGMMDLEDGVCMVTGDCNGEIIIWDFHKAKVLFIYKGQHSAKIVGNKPNFLKKNKLILLIIGIQMIKKGEKFMVASQDNLISIWRTKYNRDKPNLYPEGFIIEKIITDSFGGISTFLSPNFEKEIIIIGCMDGCIRIYDYSNKLLMGEISAFRNAAHEIICICERNEKNEKKEERNSFALIAYGFDEKNLRYWIVNKKENSFIFNEGKMQDYGTVNISERKNKIQIVGNIPNLLMIDERRQEIFVWETNLK